MRRVAAPLLALLLAGCGPMDRAELKEDVVEMRPGEIVVRVSTPSA